jgi:valyl-tRNA synthetase
MSEPLSPQYDPQATEASLYAWWQEQGYFRADEKSDREPYTIVIPPPNVTAPLHMGHGLNNTLQDLLIRWRRMQGREALWVPGTDHAGIATQNVVERQLAKEGKTRFDLGREDFVKATWEYVRETEGTIVEQLRWLGSSCDWERSRFTLDEGLSDAVRDVFVSLHEKGLVYRGNYIINWCPRCLTALSDEEAEPEEVQGKLYHLRYPLGSGFEAGDLPTLGDGRPFITVATTRPETMLGDVAVAVHPEDDRYRHLIGSEIELPLVGRRIPIIADDQVDPEFGTGAVKITPAHDPNDFEMGRRHSLASIDVMTDDAMMNESVPSEFRGLERFEARGRVIAAFREADMLDRVQDHPHSIPHCYRCHTVVEPRLSDQWFVKMQPLAEPALAASREGRVRFHPERFTKVYENWLENIRDWCISRQLWWGHRIPAWYCQAPECGEIVVSRSTPERCGRCSGGDLVQDEDVLDTWFSSWLWPFSTLGWPEETDALRKFYPTDTLVTGPDIIFFWVARMIMAGIEFRGEVPFRDVYLNGIVRDHLKRKMSKSLGNGIDPMEVVRLFGADALRFTVVTGAAAGTDQYLNYENLEEAFGPGRNFANKLWNAGRFALMNLGDEPVPTLESVSESLEVTDRWILSRLSAATVETTDSLERFRLNEAASTAYAFFWGELADWYLEMSKPRLRGELGEESRAAARATLVTVLDGVLRLLHPVVPFITETVWQRLPKRGGEAPSLMVSAWPTRVEEWENARVERQIEELREIIGAVRNIRSEYGVQPAQRMRLVVLDASAELRELLASTPRVLADLARIGEVSFSREAGEIGASTVLRSGAEIFLPLADVVDLDRERSRLRAESERVGGLLESTRKRLENETFVGRAPAEVVQKEREKLQSFHDQREKLASTLSSLEG